ncbi:MAG: YraN family protein [Emcibacteraceae bacterium]|nr:YraN family protein [Emcibacteraceae bacterium]MDG1727381.1 YraN family protein [Emcibacteraceae bacterium]
MKKDKKRKANRLGHLGEYFAILFLMVKGYSILEIRYKTKVGEIDIIAKKKNVTIFCEVKARADFESAVYSITDKQKLRIRKAAEQYMSHLKNTYQNNKIENEIFRCDMILIVPWRLPKYIENTW